jgi:hypothetical protein
MYSLQIQKNRMVSLYKNSKDDTTGKERSDLIAEKKSDTPSWLSNDVYTPFWIVYSKGCVSTK